MILNFILALGSLLFIVYAVYYSLLWLLSRGKISPNFQNTDELPRVSIIIPCLSDSPELEAKLTETASQYPPERMQIIVVWSEPPKQSSAIIEKLQGGSVEFITEATRTGKASALNLALARAREEVVVITDVDARLAEGSIPRIVREFVLRDVGAASGRLVYKLGGSDSFLDVLFNNFQNNLKEYESRIDSSSFACGELLAFRRSLIPRIPLDTISDDLYICWKVRSVGSRCVSVSDAVAKEAPPKSLTGGIVKTGRIVTGNLMEASRFRYVFFRRKYGLFGSFILPFYMLRAILSPLLFLTLLLSILWYIGSTWFFLLPELILVVGAILLVLLVIPKSSWRLKDAVLWAVGGMCGSALGLTNYFLGRRSPVWSPVEKSIA